MEAGFGQIMFTMSFVNLSEFLLIVKCPQSLASLQLRGYFSHINDIIMKYLNTNMLTWDIPTFAK